MEINQLWENFYEFSKRGALPELRVSERLVREWSKKGVTLDVITHRAAEGLPEEDLYIPKNLSSEFEKVYTLLLLASGYHRTKLEEIESYLQSPEVPQTVRDHILAILRDKPAVSPA